MILLSSFTALAQFTFIAVTYIFDPLGQPKVTAGRDHCCRTCSSVPLFKSRKTKQQKRMFVTGVTMGLAEWILSCYLNI